MGCDGSTMEFHLALRSKRDEQGKDLSDDIKGLVRELGLRFIARKDVKAFQRPDGAWFPDRTPFTMQDFRDHLSGTKTLGHYMIGSDDNCKLFAYDIDLVKHGQECQGTGCKGCPVEFSDLSLDENGNPQETRLIHKIQAREGLVTGHDAYSTLVMNLRCMADGLARMIHKNLQIPVAIAYSGNKGLHVYGFSGEMPAEVHKELATGILETAGFEPIKGQNFWRHTYAYEMLEVEVFPKQTSLDGKDLGNLMSLPLGRHQVTGNEKFFIDSRATVDRLVPKDAERVLEGDLPWE